MTSYGICTFINDIFSNYRLHSHIRISVYVSLKSLSMRPFVFGVKLSIKMLKYFNKILFRYAMLIWLFKLAMSIVYIYVYFICGIFRYFQCYGQYSKNYTSSCYKETESSRVCSLMFAVIGLTSVSLIIYMVYIYTPVLGKRKKILAHP